MTASTASSAKGHHGSPPQDSWDSMLPGPPSRDNGGGCADLSASGLLAYGAGSSVVVMDPRSMQLVSVLPMPAPSRPGGSSPSSGLAPFVTNVRWTPQPLPRDLLALDEPSTSHLRLAVGDRQGRIAIWDFRSRRVLLWLEFDPSSSSSSPSSDRVKLGVQDLCWVRSYCWILASISGPSLVALWDTASGRCIWKYDASPEFLSCLRRDPFDARHFCTIGLRGFMLSAKVLGGRTGQDIDVFLKEHQVPGAVGDLAELQGIEREALSSGTASASVPAFAIFPHPLARFCFSRLWRHILLVTFPREMILFDLQYGTSLSCMSMPRGCGKIMDVIADPDEDLAYCVHLDGKLSTWKRKNGEQGHVLCTIEDLMPSIGTPVPSPAVLTVILNQSESTLQHVSNLSCGLANAESSSSVIHESPLEFHGNSSLASKKQLLSISDDGKIWDWLLVSELASHGDGSSPSQLSASDGEGCKPPKIQTTASKTSSCAQESNGSEELLQENSNIAQVTAPSTNEVKPLFKICLIGQLQLLSSPVTTLAVPSPSLTATLGRGGNHPAAAVPLVALGTQSGNIDVIDVSANAVTTSFSVYSSAVRGLRWLGNSRLVSFSYGQANDKAGGFTNRLVVTCLRSGLNRTFRVLQKPERAPIRALRASSSGRYLLILFRDAPVEVWAMTKNPIMLRSLALPFTVMEWTLPAAPRPSQNGTSMQSSFSSGENASVKDTMSNTSVKSKGTSSDASAEDTSESFAFALVNGALGVFEVHGRRIRDFRPKWPSSSFVTSDGLVTAMAYRLPHVVMGDRSGNIRWWDVTTGLSSSFNTYREGIRRIKFSPVVSGDCSRGRIAVLFYDNTFSVFDLDTQDPLANSMLQLQSPGTLFLELDWLPTRTHRNEPLVLCITGADSSFRLIEVNINDSRQSQQKVLKERFRPMPLCLPVLLPTAHVLALRMILQLGVKPSWFNSCGTLTNVVPEACRATGGDLRNYMIESTVPAVGDPVVPELLLKVLEPYRTEGCILDTERARLYDSIVNKGAAARFAFAAAIFGDFSEALFWLQLPHALQKHLMDKSSQRSSPQTSLPTANSDATKPFTLNRITSTEKTMSCQEKNTKMKYGQLNLMAIEKDELWANAKERIPWHEKLDGEDAIQNRVHELVSVGNLEAAVTLLLSTPPEGTYFYPNALRAVVLSSAVSRSLHELAVKVVAANMVRTDKSLSGIHLLCAVGRYQEACSQLQDAGFWTDAATLAATYLHGSDYARVLQRWADHILHVEHNIWRALILYVAAGAVHEALAALRDAQHPDTAALFVLACHEINSQIASNSRNKDLPSEPSDDGKQKFILPCMDHDQDVTVVSEYYGQYQRKLVHLCMDVAPSVD